MTALGNDRFAATVTAPDLGRLELDVLGWIDHLETWRRNTVAKITAGLDVALELATGADLLDEALRLDSAGRHRPQPAHGAADPASMQAT